MVMHASEWFVMVATSAAAAPETGAVASASR